MLALPASDMTAQHVLCLVHQSNMVCGWVEAAVCVRRPRLDPTKIMEPGGELGKFQADEPPATLPTLFHAHVSLFVCHFYLPARVWIGFFNIISSKLFNKVYELGKKYTVGKLTVYFWVLHFSFLSFQLFCLLSETKYTTSHLAIGKKVCLLLWKRHVG